MRTALIVEPHPDIATLLERILMTYGWSARICDDTGSALSYAERQPVDAVLWDYSPRLITDEALRTLRDAFRPAPLVPTSTWNAASDVAAVLGVPLLKKPFSLTDVEETIRRALVPPGLDERLLIGRESAVDRVSIGQRARP